MSDHDLVDAIRTVIGAGSFSGEGYRKIWARLRLAGVRTSRRRVLRLMRAHGLLAPQRLGAARGPRSHDGTIIPERVDAMWGTDLTTLLTGEGTAAVFIAVDHCSAECVGIHAARRATRFEALEPIRQGVRERVRRWGGSRLGCPARSRQPVRLTRLPGGACVPRHRKLAGLCARAGGQWLRRALHPHLENLLWLRRFATVEELRQALLDFKERYNHSWIVERHQYRTPAQVRHDQLHPAALAA